MRDSRDAGVARILKDDMHTHVGMAIVVGSRHVLTCAHVINDALGRDRTSHTVPAEELWIGFPIGQHRPVRGKVVDWRLSGELDMAIVELCEDVPDDVGIAVLTDIADSSHDNSLSLYTACASGQRGSHAEVKARLVGSANQEETQIRVVKEEYLAPGSSGAAIWDGSHRAAIGMVRSRDEAGGPEAYAMPAAVIGREFPAVPVEKRTLSPAVLKWWSRLATVQFVGMVFFFGATLSWHSLVAKHLAAFAGALLYAIAVPTGWILARYAQQFHAHPWSSRTPATMNSRLRAGSAAGKIFAAIMVLGLVIFPAYGQCRFWLVFDDPGHVYIYPRDFGYAPEQLLQIQQPCSGHPSSNNRLCGHPCAGLWRVVQPINNAEGGYFNNRYQYGDLDGERNYTAMFYPILEPAIILLFTAAGFALNLGALLLIFRPQKKFDAARMCAEPS